MWKHTHIYIRILEQFSMLPLRTNCIPDSLGMYRIYPNLLHACGGEGTVWNTWKQMYTYPIKRVLLSPTHLSALASSPSEIACVNFDLTISESLFSNCCSCWNELLVKDEGSSVGTRKISTSQGIWGEKELVCGEQNILTIMYHEWTSVWVDSNRVITS